jgi:hydroxymethylpyrimidine pyrophosphatase-like HAD family hydrolase
MAQLEGAGAKLLPMITYNGAVVAAGEKPLVLKVKTIDRSSFAKLIRYCRQAHVSPLAYACSASPFGTVRETVYSETTKGPGIEFNGSEIRLVEDLLAIEDEVVAVLIEGPPGAAGDVLKEELTSSLSGELRVTTSGGAYIEVCHPLGTKRNAMSELAELLQIGVDEIMAIGDNFNDLEMISGAGVGVAVANAPDAVKNAAVLRCSQSGARGVVEALRVLTRVIRTEKALSGALSRRHN